MKAYIFASIAICCSAAMAETVTWINDTPNTPDTAYNWNDSDNWQYGNVGGEGDDVVLPGDTSTGVDKTIPPNEIVYIRVPDEGITVRRLQNLKSTAALIGGDIRLLSAGEGTDDERRAALNTSAQIYCDIVIPEEETISPYLKGWSKQGQGYRLCAPVRNDSTSGIYPQVTDGSVYNNFRYFAKSAGAKRTENMVSAGPFGINGGATFFMAPEAGPAASGNWELKAGSPYATRRSGSAHRLTVGTSVTGTGLPEGTFLKRVFNDATIELSEPATASGTVSLSFAAMTADFTLTLGSQFLMYGNYCDLFFYKYREENKARLEIPDFNTHSKFKSISMYIGNNGTTSCGTFVFHKVSGEGRFNFINIRHAHLEFAGDETGVTAFSDNQPFEQRKGNKDAVFSSRFTVTNNITGIVSVLSNFYGSITKDGGGLLQLGLGENIVEGSLIAEGGTLKLMRRIPTDAGTLALSSLTIKSGATVELPEGGLTVSDLVLEDGATLRGNAKLTVLNGIDRANADPRKLTCLDGASVTFVFEGGLTVGKDMFAAGSTISVVEDGVLAAGSAASGSIVKEGSGTLNLDGFNAETLAVCGGTVNLAKLDRASAVPAGAWIHVDADNAETVKPFDEWQNRLEIWWDVNGSGRSLRNHRPFNPYDPKVSQAIIVPDAINGRTAISTGVQGSYASSILIYFNEKGEKSPNFNNEPVTMEAPALRTALVVYDSRNGGGPLLSGCGGWIKEKGLLPRWDETKGDHPIIVCTKAGETAIAEIINNISNACEKGTAVFRRDGEVCNPAIVKFKKSAELVSFRHSTGRRTDVFGGYGSSADAQNCLGGIMYGEIILFERELTEAETLFAEAYLAKKWFNRKVPGYGAPSATNLFVAAGSTLTLLGDDPVTSKFVAGGGTVEGSLSLSAEGGIEVEVAEGGAVPCLTFTGSADLSNGGTVQVTGHLRDLEEGDYMLLAADAVVIGGEWSLEVPQLPEGLTMSLSVTEAGVRLRVRKKGTIIIVR